MGNNNSSGRRHHCAASGCYETDYDLMNHHCISCDREWCVSHDNAFQYYNPKNDSQGQDYDERSEDYIYGGEYCTSSSRKCGKCDWLSKQRDASSGTTSGQMVSLAGSDTLSEAVKQALKKGSISKIELERMSKEDKILWEKLSVHFRAT
jgi:hypothetical protein